MEKLHIDLGVREFELNGGLLRFNPSDPNLYHRFMEALPAIQAVEDKLVADAKQLPQQDSGAALTIENGSGETLLSYTTQRPCSALLYSAPELTDSASCTVTVNGSALGSASTAE